MIPQAWITEWRSQAPWVDDAQVEQDLIISRALVEIFSDPSMRESLAFRGGTALYKLYLTPAAGYSEDICHSCQALHFTSARNGDVSCKV